MTCRMAHGVTTMMKVSEMAAHDLDASSFRRLATMNWESRKGRVLQIMEFGVHCSCKLYS